VRPKGLGKGKKFLYLMRSRNRDLPALKAGDRRSEDRTREQGYKGQNDKGTGQVDRGKRGHGDRRRGGQVARGLSSVLTSLLLGSVGTDGGGGT
jgi:hypothetical protein